MYVLIDKTVSQEILIKNAVEHFQENYGNFEKVVYDEDRKILAISGSISTAVTSISPLQSFLFPPMPA
jgi:hypothetical protein